MGFEAGAWILSFIHNAINIVYWLIVAGIMLWIMFFWKTPVTKWVRFTIALLVGGLLMSWPIRNELEDRKNAKEAAEHYQAADVHFQECCKKAGVKIFRTVDNVEGILLMKLRPEWDPYDQNMIDPYGTDCGDSKECYIGSFLRGRDKNGTPVEDPKKAPFPGYRYVDVIEPDGKRYRYTGYMDEIWKREPRYRKGVSNFRLKCTLAKGPAPRYGVTYDDIATPEERKMWIAGSSLKIIDLKSNEVIAERIGYMFDRGMGTTGGGRSPWQHATKWACPKFPGTEHPEQTLQTRHFIEQVLKIKER